MKYFRFLIIYLPLIIYSCSGGNNDKLSSKAGPGCEYASYFGIIKDSGLTTILVKPYSKPSISETSEWISLSSGNEFKRIVCMSTSHISYFEALSETSRIIGVSGGQYISSKVIRDGIADGTIADIGYEGSLNYELLLSLMPDLVLTYGIEGENNQYIEKIKQFGINVISLGDYLENHPLGKLEYIKLFGYLLNKVDVADSIYNATKSRYTELTKVVKNRKRTKVLINAPWKEVWYIPGKESYMNLLVKDAGGVILGASENQSYTKAYSIEEVFILSRDAEVWINPNAISTMKELVTSTPLFNKIAPVINKRVFNNIKLSTSGGGSQFWESGVMEPDIILKDLISILHPDLFKEYSTKYYLHLN
ncbi:MAG: ABC transporter substrate-binding protein [Bacteroidales bacterium]|jgi:iron complex transport system substrate-binding protein|nr:ABC transporter substrate-binding protein [Bacteroidales bacterium]